MIETILDKLQRVKKNANGYTALCPAHEDRKRSLGISDGDDGTILIKCYAGCETKNILEIIGMEWKDLFPNRGENKSNILQTYDYNDENGVILYQAVRLEPMDFRQRRPDGKGGWIWKLEEVRRVLYRLSEVLKADSVFICEGEKDCEALRSIGLTATTNPGGAGKWKDEYSEFLQGKDVVILPDNDDPGRSHADQVAQSLQGKAKSIKIVNLPELPVKGDVSDWLDSMDALDPGEIIQILNALVGQTQEWKPKDKTSNGLIFTSVGDLLLEPDPVYDWLVDNLLPMGGLSVLCAKPKVGKSTLARNLAFCVSRGDSFLGITTKQGPVLYLGLEEKRSEVKTHFRTMGAGPGDPILLYIYPSPRDGLLKLKQATEKEKPALITIDPIFKMVRVKDTNAYAELSNALEPVLTIARETGAHILITHHGGKTEREGLDSLLGSTAIAGCVDSGLIMKRTENYRTIYSIQRYGEDLPETVLNLDKETGMVSTGPLRKEADQERMREAITHFLSKQPEPVERMVIEDNIQGKTGLIRHVLGGWGTREQETKIGTGKKGNPFKYSYSCSIYLKGTREQESFFDVNIENKSQNACSHPSGTRKEQETNLGTEKKGIWVDDVIQMFPGSRVVK